MKIKICHLTTVHSRYDIRIYQKMCLSLIKENYDVNLIVADGLGDEIKNGVYIFDIGKPRSRFQRIKRFPKEMYNRAMKLDADIYHFHDPELIYCGLKLRRKRKIVIMDAHEDFPKQLLGKHYMNKLVKTLLSKAFLIFESYASRKFSALVCATESIGQKFKAFMSNVWVVNNYPIVDELFKEGHYSLASKNICYIGAVSEIRGIKEIVRAAEVSNSLGKIKIAGKFNSQELHELVKTYRGWEKVEEMGILDRDGVRNLLSECVAGLVTFLPQENHIDAQPNKMFEYMSAGIPVIASNFPLWKEIINGNACGICIDPEDAVSISEAIDILINDPSSAKEMGKNGREAVLSKYNWNVEEPKLIKLYGELSKDIKK